MFEKFIGNSNLKLLCDSIENGENCSVFGLTQDLKLALANRSAKLFYVVENLDQVNIVNDKLSALGRNCQILTDIINVFTSEFTSVGKTISTLSKLINEEIDTLIITPEILCQKFPRPESFNFVNISVGQDIDVVKLTKLLTSYNYTRVELVSNQNGEMF